MLFADWQGLNTVDPTHLVPPGTLRKAQNVIVRGQLLENIPGSDEHASGLTNRVPWVFRYYGQRADNTLVKKTFCFSNGIIYVRNNDGSLTSVQTGFSTNIRPESTLTRKGGNVVQFFFPGDERPFEYDGNDANTWTLSDITQSFEQGIWWLNRLWAFETLGSDIFFSKTRQPSNFTDSTDSGSLPVAKAAGGHIVGIALLGDVLYIFKDNGIHYIEGRTFARYKVRTIFDDRGLATKRGIVKAGSAFVLLQEQDKEWYEFGGSETAWRKLSRKINFSSILNHNKVDEISTVWHDDLFRASYPDINDQGVRPNREVIFRTDEVDKDGLPKWSQTLGANIDSYAIMDRQNDNNELITGRSDTGKIMVHGRDRGENWDEDPMTIWVRTMDQVSKLGFNSKFESINLSGGAKNGTIDLRYYLDSRDTTRETGTIDQTGTVPTGSTIGAILNVTEQLRYNDYTTLKEGFNIGETLSLEFYTDAKDRGLKLYEVFVEDHPRHRKREKVAGG